jgi:hypothetical protein
MGSVFISSARRAVQGKGQVQTLDTAHGADTLSLERDLELVGEQRERRRQLSPSRGVPCSVPSITQHS